MLSIEFRIAGLGAVIYSAALFGQAAPVREAGITGPAALATKAEASYCFARVRGLDPERLPPAFLVLRLRVAVSYRNTAARPLILPLERARTVYMSLKPGRMSVFKERLPKTAPNAMTILPPDVSPESPVNPRNDVFTVIPAGGDMAQPLQEEIMLPVDRKGMFRRYPDLRGRRVFVALRFTHRELAAPLRAELSDRWSRFGVPWTGAVTTNTIQIDVPAAPEAAPCKDTYLPAHPEAVSKDRK